jgi:hypothetical protein
MREELIALREEIQRDRHATMETIQEGFNRLADKFDEHAQEDEQEFSSLKQRVTDVERTQKILGGGIVTLFTTAVGAFFTWLMGK